MWRSEFPPKGGPLSCPQSMLVRPDTLSEREERRKEEESSPVGLWRVKLERDHSRASVQGCFEGRELPPLQRWRAAERRGCCNPDNQRRGAEQNCPQIKYRDETGASLKCKTTPRGCTKSWRDDISLESKGKQRRVISWRSQHRPADWTGGEQWWGLSTEAEFRLWINFSPIPPFLLSPC